MHPEPNETSENERELAEALGADPTFEIMEFGPAFVSVHPIEDGRFVEIGITREGDPDHGVGWSNNLYLTAAEAREWIAMIARAADEADRQTGAAR